VAPCQVQEEREKDHITKEDGGDTEHIVLAVVDHATRAFVVMVAVGEGGAWTGEGGGAPAGDEERRRESRRRSAGRGGGASPLARNTGR